MNRPAEGGEPFAIPGIEHGLLSGRADRPWSSFLGAAWFEVLTAHDLPRDGTVIELDPGEPGRVGHALAMLGFHGTLLLVGPDLPSMTRLGEMYKVMLPRADIRGTAWDLSGPAPDLLLGADALVSVGVLEKVFLASLIAKADPASVRPAPCAGGGLERARRGWSRIAENPPAIRMMEEETVAWWNSMIARLAPRFVAVCRADSCPWSRDGLADLDTGLEEMFDRLRPADGTPRLIEQRLRSRGQDPSRWLIGRRQGTDGAILARRRPGAVDRLGLSTFVVMDAYPIDPARVEVVYVQSDLLSIIAGRTVREDEAKAWVAQNLLLTLDPTEGIPGARPVPVYVDRQADPLNISLIGNLGSGRAVYVGDRFNLKGIGKTVLATSKDALRSNGVLDLVGCLWEMICSNVLQTNLRTGASPALAVVDLKKDVEIPWFKDKVPGGQLIRIDPRGELDRPSHLFFREKPVGPEEMLHIARSFGAQDAEKFIERILHGGWSAGNISVHGSLIDYDSVFALRGRAPQWSFRPNWLSDFFGLEGQGQKELLKALANHPINVGNLPPEALFQAFDQARRVHLERRFLDLVGVDPLRADIPAEGFTAGLPRLVQEFQFLSMKMYPNFQATAPWDEENATLSVYDLSRFFRLYPIARRAGPVEPKTALELIRNPLGRMKTSQETKEGGMPDSVRAPLLEEFGVDSPERLAAADRRAREFIEAYEGFLAGLEQARPGSADSLQARAYVVNEERTYMNSRPGHDVLIALLQNYRAGKITPQRFSDLLNLIIEASDRIPRPDPQGRFQADLRLFLNGFASNLIGSTGWFQPRLTLLRNLGRAGSSATDGPTGLPAVTDWEVEIDGALVPCAIEEEAGRVHLIGPALPLSRLVPGLPVFRFFQGGKAVVLPAISRLDRVPPGSDQG